MTKESEEMGEKNNPVTDEQMRQAHYILDTVKTDLRNLLRNRKINRKIKHRSK